MSSFVESVTRAASRPGSALRAHDSNVHIHKGSTLADSRGSYSANFSYYDNIVRKKNCHCRG
jgi:hypothetical protein